MPIQIINGFPQYYELGYYTSSKKGDIVTEANPDYTDIDLMNDTIGNSIPVDTDNVHLLTVVRDGATLILGEGFELISENIVRLYPGLITGETVVFKRLFAAAEIGPIPVDPTPEENIEVEREIISAIAWTDDLASSINVDTITLVGGKTRIKTDFSFNNNQIDVFINGQYISPAMVNDNVEPIWSIPEADTIELDGDYSTAHMSVQIVRKVYEEI